jgi:hypothetical protein
MAKKFSLKFIVIAAVIILLLCVIIVYTARSGFQNLPILDISSKSVAITSLTSDISTMINKDLNGNSTSPPPYLIDYRTAQSGKVMIPLRTLTNYGKSLTHILVYMYTNKTGGCKWQSLKDMPSAKNGVNSKYDSSSGIEFSTGVVNNTRITGEKYIHNPKYISSTGWHVMGPNLKISQLNGNLLIKGVNNMGSMKCNSSSVYTVPKTNINGNILIQLVMS